VLYFQIVGEEMLTIKTKLPTKNLPIRRVLPKLFQSYIYTALDDKEHHGYKHPNGKLFKAMNFKIAYIDNEIHAKYVALDNKNEKKVAEYILYNSLKLGEIHLSNTSVGITERNSNITSPMRVGGFVSANIQDGKRGKKKIYLEPKSDKFQEIVHRNTLEKYEALFGKPYQGELKIKLIEQKPRERIFHYSKGVIKAWFGVYEIEGDEDILRMILDTGMGANCMKGVGFVEILKEKKDG
jgi:CRISPR-associated endoribonuclease Cas6